MKFIFNNISKSIIKNLLDNKYAVAGVSGVVLLLGSYAAHAQVASVSAAVNLRQGPGAGYGRIAALPRGVNVHINSCRGGWCQIRSSWGVGWVSGRYLLRGYAGSNYAPNYAPAYDSDYSAPQSQVIFGLNIGSGYSDDDYYSPYYLVRITDLIIIRTTDLATGRFLDRGIDLLVLDTGLTGQDISRVRAGGKAGTRVGV